MLLFFMIILTYILICAFWTYSIFENGKLPSSSLHKSTIIPTDQAVQGALFAYMVLGGYLLANLYNFASMGNDYGLGELYLNLTILAGTPAALFAFCAMLMHISKKHLRRTMIITSIVILVISGLLVLRLLYNFFSHALIGLNIMIYIKPLWWFITKSYIAKPAILLFLVSTAIYIHKHVKNRTLREMNVYNFFMVLLPYSCFAAEELTLNALISLGITDTPPIMRGGN